MNYKLLVAARTAIVLVADIGAGATTVRAHPVVPSAMHRFTANLRSSGARMWSRKAPATTVFNTLSTATHTPSATPTPGANNNDVAL